MINKTSLTIVIPAYNEEESLGYVLDNTISSLPKYIKRFEIIIVENGSTDRTPQIADSYAKRYKTVSVIHESKSSFNNAMISGIKSANMEYVSCMPANGKILSSDMARCFEMLGDYDLIMGVRGNRFTTTLVRKMLSLGSMVTYLLLFGLTYEDVHWVYFWKTSEIKKIKLDPDGGVFLLTESLIKFKRKGLSIGEAPAPFRPRIGGKQKAVRLATILKTLRSALVLKWKILTGKV